MENAAGLDGIKLAELLDRIAGKFDAENIHWYLPAEHHWPEHSLKREITCRKNQPLPEWQTGQGPYTYYQNGLILK